MEIYRGLSIISLEEEDNGNWWAVMNKEGKELARLPTIDDCYDWIDACVRQYEHITLGQVVSIREMH